jgi:hypothetical protein
MMTKRVISQVQDYLTVVGEDRVYQIVNVELLLRKHPPESVIAFNKTDSKINELVAKNFRIKMAINTIKNAKEVKDAA